MQADGSEDSSGDKKWRKNASRTWRTIPPFGSQRLPPPPEIRIHWITRQKMIILLFNFDVKNAHKGAKNIQGGKDSLFDKWRLENYIATWKRVKLDTVLQHTHTHTHKCLEME